MLAALAANDLYLSAKKCTFHQSSVAFLGVLISPDGVSIDPSKIKAVQDWARPTNVTGIQELIGTANFVRRHIKDFSTLVRPLTLLTRKTVPFVWTDACERAFQGLKEALTSAPVLAFPDPSEPYEIFTDASDVAIGAVLMQSGPEGRRPVAYHSTRVD